MTKKKHKNEERKMRIKYEHSVNYLKSQGEILMDKISFEEDDISDFEFYGQAGLGVDILFFFNGICFNIPNFTCFLLGFGIYGGLN